MKENTENNGYALFEVSPETHLKMANDTALDDLNKVITEATIKLNQIEANLGLKLTLKKDIIEKMRLENISLLCSLLERLVLRNLN